MLLAAAAVAVLAGPLVVGMMNVSARRFPDACSSGRGKAKSPPDLCTELLRRDEAEDSLTNLQQSIAL
jgi:hypothetical protein